MHYFITKKKIYFDIFFWCGYKTHNVSKHLIVKTPNVSNSLCLELFLLFSLRKNKLISIYIIAPTIFIHFNGQKCTYLIFKIEKMLLKQSYIVLFGHIRFYY